MHVIGTAGHVDHGKSTLIAALTGTHPDRLKEEQEREMTIDLGFGWLRLPEGEEVGIVDVPGHRDFIENMLAGVGGIDAVLLVIAADEGIMPQTREHLAIIDLLQIPAGLVVLTKIDLADDPEWLALVENDITSLKAGTILEQAPILRVSSRTGQGLSELVQALAGLLQASPSKRDLGRPRLPIDRVFSMSGFGTIVTGTLSDGSLSLGDEVEVLPSRLHGRVRGLQTHNKQQENALPSSRTAINLSGIAAEDIQRGEVVVRPGQYQPVRRLDARLRLLPDVSIPLHHNTQVKFFTGTCETMASVRLLGTEELLPGQEGWIQLELSAPVVAVRGDRYILRRPSPGETLGGGQVVDHQPAGRHKRFDEHVLRSLESLSRGTPAEVLLEAAVAAGIAPVQEVVRRSHLEPGDAAAALQELLESGQLVTLEEGTPSVTSDLLISGLAGWQGLEQKTASLLSDYHQAFPLRRGMPREELKSRLKLSQRVFNALVRKLIDEGQAVQTGTALAEPTHRIQFDEQQQGRIKQLERTFSANPYMPPTARECRAEAGDEVIAALIEQGELIALSAEVLFRKSDYDVMVEQVRRALQEHGRITLAETRDLFGTSRKYAQALLEHLDAIGMTARDGDYRRLRA